MKCLGLGNLDLIISQTVNTDDFSVPGGPAG